MAKVFSEQFIQKQKERLLKEKESLLDKIKRLKEEDPFADPDHASDNAAVDTDVREQVGHETIQAQIDDLTEKLKNIEEALKRIFKENYGLCLRCNKVITQARLEIIPETGYCIDCEKHLRK